VAAGIRSRLTMQGHISEFRFQIADSFSDLPGGGFENSAINLTSEI
jgi:hypothetical protein